MRRRIAVVWIFVFLLVATCFAQLNMLPHWALVFKVKAPTTGTEATVASRDAPTAAVQSVAPAAPPTAGDGSALKPEAKTPASEAVGTGVRTGIDIARISRNGPSVFAGKAAPNARVTVLDGTKEVATAIANDSGDWSTVTDYKFANTDPDIRLKALEPEAHAAESGGAPLSASAVPASASPSIALMQSFENVVAAAREEAKKAPSSSSPPTKAVPQTTVTPLPMTFVYDQDVLTPEGHHSTQLLLEYLKLKHFASVTLSGHADERGTADYNVDLSRKRLDTIFRQLRDGGYDGRLTLVPKGSSEPYMGVDRTRYPHEELMQLDRRVELRGAE